MEKERGVWSFDFLSEKYIKRGGFYMGCRIERANDLESLAAFLAEMNNQKTDHIGFCGTNQIDILQALKEDFIDEKGEITFFVVRNHSGEILAACGLDIENDEAEVWGPFNRTESLEWSVPLWQQLIDHYPAVPYFSFFINEENRKQQAFMKQIGAKEGSKQLNLIIYRNRFEKLEEQKCSSFSEYDFPAFQELHDGIFLNTYYDAETIRNRLNKNNILKVLKENDGEFIGYAYFEINKELSEASLEYFAVSNNYQNKGFGSLLLKEALTVMFSFPEIDEVYLMVDADNHHANHVYKKIGFEKGDTLVPYKMKY